ncbi:hypothetical protein LJC18_05575 [Lachnospiraceae bacterium OttesenSCG-928-E19]|nr:hypothetical protein [Lachnospiraceae bacterium OttesenSCG-928-E19]
MKKLLKAPKALNAKNILYFLMLLLMGCSQRGANSTDNQTENTSIDASRANEIELLHKKTDNLQYIENRATYLYNTKQVGSMEQAYRFIIMDVINECNKVNNQR